MEAVRWALVVSLIVGSVLAVLVALRSVFIDFRRCRECRKRLPRRAAQCPHCDAVLR